MAGLRCEHKHVAMEGTWGWLLLAIPWQMVHSVLGEQGAPLSISS